MSTNYKGLIKGNIQPMELAELLLRVYGSDRNSVSIHFTHDEGFVYIHFTENATAEQKMLRPWDRAKVVRKRQMAVFYDGSCTCDYDAVTTEPATYVSLGHSGECKEIINSLLAARGGWFLDDLGTEEWTPYRPAQQPALVAEEA